MVKRFLLSLVLFGIFLPFLYGCVARAHSPPPPAYVEVRPTRPFTRAVWIDGHWERRHGEWVWVSGRWAKRPNPKAVWVPGYWRETPLGWKWVPGYWR